MGWLEIRTRSWQKSPKLRQQESTKHQPCAERNQFSAKNTKPPPAERTKPNHVLTSTGTGFHKSVKQCKSLRCWEVKLSPREVPRILSQLPQGVVKASQLLRG